MPALPMEITMKVLEMTYYKIPSLEPSGFNIINASASASVDYATLSACSLVCSSWKSFAQKLLFRLAELLHAKHYFSQTINPSTERGRFLGRHVRVLDVVLARHDVPMAFDPATLVHLLSACPDLYALTIRIDGLHEINAFALTKLAELPNVATIRSLRLLFTGVQSPVLCQLLSIWSLVQFLTIGSEMAAPLPSKALKVKLYELVLQRTPSDEVLDYLLSGSHSSLSILTLWDPPSPGVLRVLTTYCPQLRSLRLAHYNKHTAAVLRLCVNIEEFILFHVPNGFKHSSLPASVEHFGFSSTAHNFLQGIVAIATNAPSLKVLTCIQDPRPFADVLALETACTQRNVTMRTQLRSNFLVEDPVSVRRFPRTRSVSNFRLMNRQPCAEIKPF